MSMWTYVNGVINVVPMGQSTAHKRYVLDTVLNHLPRVTGSEGDMDVFIVEEPGYNASCTHNEFGQWMGPRGFRDSCMHVQNNFMVVINGKLRDRVFDETVRELSKWLNRLAKRVDIHDILVSVKAYDKKLVISDPTPYFQMAEWPSWCEQSGGEPAWAEFMLWDRAKNSGLPILLEYKYYNDPENNAEVERRRKYSGLYED